MPAFGSCNLASINLGEFVKSPFTKYARFEFEKFSELVHDGVIYLNEVLDENMNLHPMWRCYKQHNGKSEICIKNTVTVDRVGFVREE